MAVREPTASQREEDRREVPAGDIGVQTFALTSALRRHRVLR